MTQAEDRTSLQNKCRPTESLSSIMQKIELALRAEAALETRCCRKRRDIVDGQSHLSDVVFYEELCSSIGAGEEARGGYVPQIAHKTGAQETDEGEDIFVFSGLDDGLESFVDQPVIVVFTRCILSPGDDTRSVQKIRVAQSHEPRRNGHTTGRTQRAHRA